jgi:hypothetical protein
MLASWLTKGGNMQHRSFVLQLSICVGVNCSHPAVVSHSFNKLLLSKLDKRVTPKSRGMACSSASRGQVQCNSARPKHLVPLSESLLASGIKMIATESPCHDLRGSHVTEGSV